MTVLSYHSGAKLNRGRSSVHLEVYLTLVWIGELLHDYEEAYEPLKLALIIITTVYITEAQHPLVFVYMHCSTVQQT